MASSSRDNKADGPAPPEPFGRQAVAVELGVAPSSVKSQLQPPRRAWISPRKRQARGPRHYSDGLLAAGTTLVAALGTSACGDDGAGPLVVRLLGELGPLEGVRLHAVADPLLLLETWNPGDRVLLFDAARTDAPTGTLLTIDALASPLPPGVHPLSSHGFGLPEALALARRLKRLPERLIVLAIVGSDFTRGARMSPRVCAMAERLARTLHTRLSAPLAELASAR